MESADLAIAPSDAAGSSPESVPSESGPSVREAINQAAAKSNDAGKVPAGTPDDAAPGGVNESDAPRTVRNDIQQAAKTIGHQNDAKAAGFETPLHHLSAAALPYCQQHGIGGVEELMGTALYAEYTLRTGTPQERAAVVQWICQQYGVPFPQGAARAPSAKPKGRGRPETVRDTLRAAHAQRKH